MDWRNRVIGAQSEIERAKQYFEKMREKYLRDDVYTIREASDGTKSLVVLKRPKRRTIENKAIKRANLDNFLCKIEDLPDYWKVKDSADEGLHHAFQVLYDAQDGMRQIIASLQDKHLQRLYKKRREIYDAYINSQEWRQKREQVLQLKGSACFVCGCDYDDIHHLHYETLGDECTRNDLEPVCRACHLEIHSEETP